MEELTIEQQNAINQLYEYVAELMFIQKKNYFEIKTQLIQEGLDEKTAIFIVQSLELGVKEAETQRAKKNIWYGVLWCLLGAIALIAKVSFIFWAIVIFGIYKISKGVFDTFISNKKAAII